MKSLYLFILCVIFSIACSKNDDSPECPCSDPSDPECPNYDPCFGKSPVTADFNIFDDVFFFGPHAGGYFQDSYLYSGSFKMEAIEKNAHYTWYLGTEVVTGFGDSVVTRGISSLEPGMYSAALVVEKAPDTLCFPMDLGRDSIYKTFTIVDKCDLLILNKFQGVFETAPNDSMTIEFMYLDPNTKEPDCQEFDLGGVNLRGLGDTTITGNLMAVGHRFIEWRQNDFTKPVGNFTIFPDSSCFAEYELRGESYSFNGRKTE